jgi:hypothetical protein
VQQQQHPALFSSGVLWQQQLCLWLLLLPELVAVLPWLLQLRESGDC